GNVEYGPEQLIDGSNGPYTDVYALGAVLYQLLTGIAILVGTTADEVAHLHLFTAIQLVGQSSDPSAGLYSIIAQALAKDPKQRYQQAGALANAYHQVLDPNDRHRVPFVIISPSVQAQQPFVPETVQAERQLTEREWSTNESAVFDLENGLQSE